MRSNSIEFLRFDGIWRSHSPKRQIQDSPHGVDNIHEPPIWFDTQKYFWYDVYLVVCVPYAMSVVAKFQI